MERYLKKSARPGAKRKARQRAASREVKLLLQHVSDLPRRADFKAALRFP